MSRRFLLLLCLLALSGCRTGPPPIARWQVGNEQVLAAAILPEGTQVVYSVTSGFANLWDLQTGRPLYSWQLDPKPASAFTVMAVSANGAVIAMADAETLSLWSPRAGRPMGLWSLPGIRAIAVSADGQYALLGLPAGRAQWLHLATGSVVGEFNYSDDTNAVAISHDRRLLMTGGDDRRVRLWDARDGTLKAVWPHSNIISALSFSPDGRLAVSNAASGPVRIWDTATGKALGTLPGIRRVTASVLRLSPDGRLLAVGTPNGRIQVFEMRGYNRIARFQLAVPHLERPSSSVVADIRFLNDMQSLLSTDLNGGVQRWQLP